MTKITVVAGDWPSGTVVTYAKGFFGKPSSLLIGWTGGRFYAQHIASAVHVTEQNSTSILGKVGWGAVGGVALGPLGVLAGVLGGGNNQHTIVALELVDGRKALLKCDPAGFAAVMEASHKSTPPIAEDLEWVKDTPEYRFLNGIASRFGKRDKPRSSARPTIADLVAERNAARDMQSSEPPRSNRKSPLQIACVLGIPAVVAAIAAFTNPSVTATPSTVSTSADRPNSDGIGTPPSELRMWVLSDYTERRTCPSVGCGSVGKLSRGEAVMVSERTPGWVRISKYYTALCENGLSVFIERGSASCSPSNGIVNGELAEWVELSALTSVQLPDPSLGATGVAVLVKGSDDFHRFESQFIAAATQLLSDGTCSESDFINMGGFVKSSVSAVLGAPFTRGREGRCSEPLRASTYDDFRVYA